MSCGTVRIRSSPCPHRWNGARASRVGKTRSAEQQLFARKVAATRRVATHGNEKKQGKKRPNEFSADKRNRNVSSSKMVAEESNISKPNRVPCGGRLPRAEASNLHSRHLRRKVQRKSMQTLLKHHVVKRMKRNQYASVRSLCYYYCCNMLYPVSKCLMSVPTAA